MTQDNKQITSLRLADLAAGAEHSFNCVPDKAWRSGVVQELDLLELRKLALRGKLSPLGKSDWHLTGTLGATVVQPCCASLEPVVTRIDVPIERKYLTQFDLPQENEVEMPEDDTVEPMVPVIDLCTIALEELSLALPLYPRASQTPKVQLSTAEPGVTPMTDEDAKPFAGLADLKAKLSEDNR